MEPVGEPPADYSPLWDEVRLLQGKPLFYDKSGQALTLRQFSQRFRDLNYKIIRRSHIGGWQVVTAWLGMDQRDVLHRESGEPLIFGVTRYSAATGYDDAAEHFFPREDAALGYHEELRRRCEQEDRNAWVR